MKRILSYSFLGVSLLSLLVCVYLNSTAFTHKSIRNEIQQATDYYQSYFDEFETVIQSFQQKDTLTISDFTAYYHKPYTTLLFEGNQLKYWSNNQFNKQVYYFENNGKEFGYYEDAKKYYLYRSLNLDDGKLLFLLPIANKNSTIFFHNQKETDLKFSAVNPTVSFQSPIQIKTDVIGYVYQPNPTDVVNTEWIVTAWGVFIITFIIGVSFIFSSSFITIFKLHKISILILIYAVLVMFVRYDPFQISEHSKLFGPTLFANPYLGNSLGVLGVTIICFLSVFFIWRKTPMLLFYYGKNFPKWLKIILAAISFIVIDFIYFYIIRSVVIDSSIVFHLKNLYQIHNIFLSLLLLFATIAFFFFAIRTVRYINKVASGIQNRIFFIAVAVILTFCLMVYFYSIKVALFQSLWVFIYIVLLFSILKSNNRVNKIEDIVNIILTISILCTFIYTYFGNVKDEAKLKQVARKIALESNPLDEFLLQQLIKNIQADQYIQKNIDSPFVTDQSILKRINSLYFSDEFGNYSKDIAIYSSEKELSTYSNETKESVKLITGRYDVIEYLITVPIFLNQDLKNVIEIKLNAPKLLPADTFLSKYKQVPSSDLIASEFRNFDFTVYKNQQPIFVRGELLLEKNEKADAIKVGDFKRLSNVRNKQYIYKVNNNTYILLAFEKTVAINRTLVIFANIFSLLLAAYIISILILRGFKLIQSNFFSSSFANRIQFFVILVIYSSAFTISVFSFNSLAKQVKRVQSISQLEFVSKISDNFLRFQNTENIILLRDEFILYLSNNFLDQQESINFYDVNGNLVFTNTPYLFEENFWPDKVDPTVLEQFLTFQQNNISRPEQELNIDYNGYYSAIRNRDLDLVGILYYPAFDDKLINENQESKFSENLLSTLSFLVLIITYVTLFASSFFTAFLDRIRKHLSVVDIGKTSEIEGWTADDEIGSLINEYNTMVKKLDENAVVLARSERESAWRDLAKQIAHEIKNPLTPMKLNIQQLKRRMNDNEENNSQVIDTLDSLIVQIDHLSKIADNFSTMSKMNLPEFSVIDLKKEMKQVQQLFETTQNYVVEFFDEVETETALINADATMLNRILNNLIKNAIQALKLGKGYVHVTLKETNETYSIHVEDNGKGIPIENRAKIFTPNFTTKKSGTGIGLMMTKKIVEMHNGTIRFESVKNEGTKFIVELPKYKDEQ